MTEIFYGKSVEAMCADGKVRRAVPRRYCYDGSMASDTWFSCPAFVRVNGKTVRGYVRGREPGDDSTAEYAFHAYTYSKNANALALG